MLMICGLFDLHAVVFKLSSSSYLRFCAMENTCCALVCGKYYWLHSYYLHNYVITITNYTSIYWVL